MADSDISIYLVEPSTEASSSRATVPPNNEMLDECHKRLKKERDTLLKQIKVWRLEKEIEILYKQTRALEEPADDASQGTKRQRSDTELDDDTLSARYSSTSNEI
jgi:hypothetical protein